MWFPNNEENNLWTRYKSISDSLKSAEQSKQTHFLDLSPY